MSPRYIQILHHALRVRFFDCRARRLCRANRVSGKRYHRTRPYTVGGFCTGTLGSLAQPPKTKEPYGCGIPLAGACPTVCQLQAVSVDRVGGGLCREKRESMLLLYASTVNKQYHSICYSFTLIVLSAMALAHTDKPQKQQRIPFPALRNRTHIPVHKQPFP